MRDASGATCFSLPDAPDFCTFHMRRNDVRVGANVTVAPRDGSTLTFSSVSAPGTAAIVPLTEADGLVPPGFQILSSGTTPIFYDASTTALISGTITTCLAYPDTDNDGMVDGASPPIEENDLQVLHEEAGFFVDRTLSLDPVLKQVCGATPSLSQLVLGAGGGAPACEGLGGDSDGDTLCDDEDPCKFFPNTLPLERSDFSGIPCECLCGDSDGDCFHSATDAAAINDCASLIRFDCISERDEVVEPIDGIYSGTDADCVNRVAAFLKPAYTLICPRRPEGTCDGMTGVSCF